MRDRLPATREGSPALTLLSGLTSHQREMALQRAERRNFAANDVIIHAGKLATRLIQLTRGSAKLYRLTKSGDEVVLWWLAPEDVFGVGALLSRPWHYIGTVQAVEDCEVLVWNRDSLRQLSATCELITANVLQIVMNALAAHANRMVEMTGETAEQRLARTLIHVAHRTGKVRPEGVDITITNEDLGNLAHVSMFTASRILQKWARKKLIEKGRGTIRLFSPENFFTD